jgi:hypothetical protein
MRKETVIDTYSSVSVTESSTTSITGSALALPTISYGRNRGKTTTQSGLVLKSLPPKKPVGIIGMFVCSGTLMLIIYALLALHQWNEWLVRMVLFAIGVPLFVITVMATLRTEDMYLDARWQWQQEWICLRCSHDWVP